MSRPTSSPARFLLCLTAITLMAVGCNFSSQHVARETRNVTHVSKQQMSMLTVVTRNGYISVEQDDTVKDITVTASVHASGKNMAEAQARLKKVKINITEAESGDVSITTSWPSPDHTGDGVDFKIRVPALKGFNGQTTNHRVTVTGADGPVTIKTSNDDVSMFGCKQTATINTSNGDIQVKDHAGDVTIVTSNGDVDLSNLMGAASVETSNGLVTINLNEKSSAPVQATTSNDSINLTCGSGWNGVIKAQTQNGLINLTGADGRISNQTISDSSATLTVGSGGEVSRLTASNDDIGITIK
ncbi:MAG: hypothetical protein MK089_06370 [Phycisphaerales bacterium]|nr:hypothetical protein [Phycisphaerales bacterium]